VGTPGHLTHPHVETPLDAVQAGGIPGRPGGPGQQEPGDDELELEPRRGRARHLGESGIDDVGGA
jgi:hypothetical protein